MDDFAITVTLNSAKSNCKKLERIALELIFKAKEAAISFNIVEGYELLQIRNYGAICFS